LRVAPRLRAFSKVAGVLGVGLGGPELKAAAADDEQGLGVMPAVSRSSGGRTTAAFRVETRGWRFP
jgi:hypothetical protein